MVVEIYMFRVVCGLHMFVCVRFLSGMEVLVGLMIVVSMKGKHI